MQTGQKESRMEFDRPDDRIPPKYVTPIPKFVQDLNSFHTFIEAPFTGLFSHNILKITR